MEILIRFWTRCGGMGAKAVDALRRNGGLEFFQCGMPHEIDMTPIVEAGTSQRTIIQAKAETPDEVQPCLGGSAEPGNVSGVGRYLRLPERDVQHVDSCYERANCSRCA